MPSDCSNQWGLRNVSDQPKKRPCFSIGLTGGIGCGKTTVADRFAARGADVIDTDQIAHRLTMAGGSAIAAIRHRFGEEFLTATGAMDRAKMRALVFTDPAAKMNLEAILHPLIRDQTKQIAQQSQGLYLLLVVPLLVETGGWKEDLSRILVIDCPEPLQIQRVMARNGFSEAEVRAIMATQASRAARIAIADDVILNDATLANVDSQIDRLHRLYCSLANSMAPI